MFNLWHRDLPNLAANQDKGEQTESYAYYKERMKELYLWKREKYKERGARQTSWHHRRGLILIRMFACPGPEHPSTPSI